MRFFLFLSCISALFLGCTKNEPNGHKKILHLAIQDDPASLDPRRGGDILSSHIQLMLFEGLVRLNPDGTVSPGQAHSFTISSDRKIYTFYLGKTKWSNGDPVTAYDFAISWKDILSPSFPAPNAHLFYPIKNAEAVKTGKMPINSVGIYVKDPLTLIIELEKPTPYFLPLITFCAFAPIPSKIVQNSNNWSLQKPLVSNGPFTLVEWEYQQKLILKKNPFYPTSSHLHGIEIHVVRSEETAFALYKQGQLDVLGYPFSSIPKDCLSLLPKEELLFCPVAATTFITFNTQAFPFSNKHLRKALGLCIDRKEITSSVLELGEKEALSAVCPALKGCNTDAFYEDFAKSAALSYLNQALVELGITKEELEKHLIYYYPPHSRLVAQVLQQQWLSHLGIHVQIQCVEQKMLLAKLSSKEYLFAHTLLRAQYLDPLSVLDRFVYKDHLKNYPGWESLTYQKLLKQAAKEQGSARLATLASAEALLLEEMVVAPLFHTSLCFVKKNYVENVSFSPTGGVFFERLDLSK